MIDEIAKAVHTSSKGRSNPRVVKRRIKKFPSKKGGEPMNQKFNWQPVIAF